MMKALALACAVACVLLATSAAAGFSHPDSFPSRLRRGSVYRRALHEHERRMEAAAQYRNTTVMMFAQLLNHSNPAQGTFQQRTWYDLSNYSGGDFAMLYINGEGPARGSPDGAMGAYCHSIGAACFTPEHRFYGDSLPYPLTNRSGLALLSVEQALADLQYYKTQMEATVLGGKPHKWFIVGGSYSGALSAWSKEMYPNDYVAAWSSSGVVNAIFDYTAFDGHIVSQLSADCAKAVKYVYTSFEAALANPAARANAMSAFGFPGYFSDTDMMWSLADQLAMAVQYGAQSELCDNLDYTMQSPFAAFNTTAAIITDLWGPGACASAYYSTQALSNPQFSAEWGSDGYCWVYQCCSQLAYWQVSYPGSLRSSLITSDYYINQCRTAFGATTFPDTYAFNAKYGGATPFGVNVVATQGSSDPWKPAGVQSSLGPLYPEVTAECYACGHCGDLMTPSPEDPQHLVDQRNAVYGYLNQWLGVA